MEKEKKISDGTTELITGNTILLCNDFADGMVLEKILVILGLLISTVGIIRAFLGYKKKSKKGMCIFLGILGTLYIAAFIGLLCMFIFKWLLIHCNILNFTFF